MDALTNYDILTLMQLTVIAIFYVAHILQPNPTTHNPVALTLLRPIPDHTYPYMQTFLPYPSFTESVKALDYRRLGKQRVECAQILKALKQGGGWSRHPATLMWQGYEPALEAYLAECISEWISRGYKNSMSIPTPPSFYSLPPWLGNPRFHASHRSNLLRKDPTFYSRFNWSEPPTLDYIWPTSPLPPLQGKLQDHTP